MTPEPGIPLWNRARQHAGRLAIVAPDGEFSYEDLLVRAARGARLLLDGARDLAERRVAFLVPPGFSHVEVQWSIWRAGGVAVPLCVSHPRPELEYVLQDADADIVVADPIFEPLMRPLAEASGRRFLSTRSFREMSATEDAPTFEISPRRRAMIVYTSGTTSRPKGVVSTHRTIEAQINSLVTAWGWRPEDHILQVLPLHHVHGIINVLACALWSGARCEILPKFDSESVWQRFVDSDLTLFMAVPTIYAKLIAAWEKAAPATRARWSEACSKMRLMVSGSAALPVQVLETWQRISGHVLLERYGMTEIGMALSNPLHGTRTPGCVGVPLPGVEVRLVDETGDAVDESTPGEIQVKGPGVFAEYWRRPDATRNAFRDGWFQTGDVAVVNDSVYRILGRKSVDIIKSGGYKISALEIEEQLREHPDIEECAVIGLPDPEWGERVAAALVFSSGRDLSLDGLRRWAKERMAPYKVPTRILKLESLPRNAMGKVTKPEVVKLFEAE